MFRIQSLQLLFGAFLLSILLAATAVLAALASLPVPEAFAPACSKLALRALPAAFAATRLRCVVRPRGAGQGGYNGTRIGEASHTQAHYSTVRRCTRQWGELAARASAPQPNTLLPPLRLL